MEPSSNAPAAVYTPSSVSSSASTTTAVFNTPTLPSPSSLALLAPTESSSPWLPSLFSVDNITGTSVPHLTMMSATVPTWFAPVTAAPDATTLAAAMPEFFASPAQPSGSADTTLSSSTVDDSVLDSDTETDDDDEPDDADGEVSSGSVSQQQALPANVQTHVDKMNAELEKLRLSNANQQQQIKKLRLEHSNKSKEINQVRDLNIKLQLELDRYRSSASALPNFSHLSQKK